AARHDELQRAAEWCLAAQSQQRGGEEAEIVGLHIEGPYINPRRKGAQPAAGIRDPDFDECAALLAAAGGQVRVMTLAPELPGGVELVRFLRERGVIASLGHTDADYDTALAAVEAGATHATHLFNQMRRLHHRDPGVAVACLNESRIVAEVIADGVHLAPGTVHLTVRAKGADGVALVTDAISAVGRPDGEYALGPQTVYVRGDRCTLADGTFAGSMLTMERGTANLMRFAGVSLAEAARMASLVPARIAGCVDRKGSLEPGKDADIILLTPAFQVVATVARGRLAYLTPAGAERLRSQ
ncbi:MAG: N-acetylglucosamine-6-phosphate deacetylase, partial [Armatimonadetes bacterium]|nr:N-acetylglucosamine-6-phosphate deacetylase [Armatimonadota bacterium]